MIYPIVKRSFFIVCLCCVLAFSSALILAAETPARRQPWATSCPDIQTDCIVGYSNSYVGNTWRNTTVNIFTAYCKRLKNDGIIGDFIYSSSGNDVYTQIQELYDMRDAGCDIIICNPASAKEITPILDELAAQGVIVICLGNYIYTKDVYTISTNQYAFGVNLASNLAQMLNGKGNILWLKGMENSGITILRSNGIKSVLRDYPDIHILGTGYTSWGETAGKQVMNHLMNELDGQKIDGILDEGGAGNAIIQTLVEYNYDPTTIAIAEGETSNSFLKNWADLDLTAWGCIEPPYLIAAAVNTALNVLAGNFVTPYTLVDASTCESKEQAIALYDEDQADNWICVWTDPENSYHLDKESILNALKP